VTGKGRNKSRPSKEKKDEARYVLDQFTKTDLSKWQRLADGLDAHHISLYFYLEGLRKLHQEDVRKALQAPASVSIAPNNWSRIVGYKYTLAPLSAAGSIVSGGRFNIGGDLDPNQFPPFPALYIAENYETAYAEKFGMTTSESRDGLSGHELALRKPTSFSHVSLSGELSNLFDAGHNSSFTEFSVIISNFKITRELKASARRIGIKKPLVIDPTMLKQTLLGNDWRNYPVQYQIPANPQVFGRLIKDAGYEGIVYPSTKGKGKCIAIFPENFEGSDSYMEIADTPPKEAGCTRLDSKTWQDLTG